MSLFTCTRPRQDGTTQTQLLLCADLEDPNTLDLVKKYLPEQVRAVYSDPPWNLGISNMFRSRVGLGPCPSFLGLMEAWARIPAECQVRGAQDILVEHSADPIQYEMLLEAVQKCENWKLSVLESWTVTYGSPKKRNKLFHYGLQQLSASPALMSGDGMVKTALEGLTPKLKNEDWVVDPCMGAGTTSRVVHRLGCNAFGTELSEERLKITTAWLEGKSYRGVATETP